MIPHPFVFSYFCPSSFCPSYFDLICLKPTSNKNKVIATTSNSVSSPTKTSVSAKAASAASIEPSDDDGDDGAKEVVTKIVPQSLPTANDPDLLSIDLTELIR